MVEYIEPQMSRCPRRRYGGSLHLMVRSAALCSASRTRTSGLREVGRLPLCLLTPDMQNRRIIDGLLRSAGSEPAPTLESNSTGKWASIMPAKLAEILGLTDSVRSIPIVEPAATHAI